MRIRILRDLDIVDKSVPLLPLSHIQYRIVDHLRRCVDFRGGICREQATAGDVVGRSRSGQGRVVEIVARERSHGEQRGSSAAQKNAALSPKGVRTYPLPSSTALTALVLPCRKAGRRGATNCLRKILPGG